ncbi:uncharacterized protein CBL_20337 [Carabus blaptoides fortunei]
MSVKKSLETFSMPHQTVVWYNASRKIYGWAEGLPSDLRKYLECAQQCARATLLRQCITIWDKSLIKIEQDKDEHIKLIREKIEQNPESNEFYVDEDELVFKVQGKDEQKDRLVIPKTSVNKFIYDYHDLPYAGHQGVTKTYHLMKIRMYWQNMNQDIKDYIKKYHSCNKRKTTNQKPAHLQRFQEIKCPFQLTAMDIVGTFVTSDSGNRYVLTFQDYFIKYPEAIPTI